MSEVDYRLDHYSLNVQIPFDELANDGGRCHLDIEIMFKDSEVNSLSIIESSKISPVWTRKVGDVNITSQTVPFISLGSFNDFCMNLNHKGCIALVRERLFAAIFP